MRTITSEEILESIDHLHSLSESGMRHLTADMQKEQPYIQVYTAVLMEQGEFEDDNDADAFANLSAVVWYAMRSGADQPLAHVKGRGIDLREQEIMRLYEYAGEEKETHWPAMIKAWLEGYNQRPLLEFVLETLNAPDNPYEVTPHGAGMIFIYLKIIIDCLDQTPADGEQDEASEEAGSPGRCMLCDALVEKEEMGNHLAQCLGEHTEDEGKTIKFFHLAVEGYYAPQYWLQVDIPGAMILENLDEFLRDTWLECCGHLSCFTIRGQRYAVHPSMDEGLGEREKSMSPKIYKVLEPGIEFQYEYDYGSTTDLFLRVIGTGERKVKKPDITLLARNEPPELKCADCGKPAVWIRDAGGGIFPELLCCDDCLDEDEEEVCLPLVNSPRAGVCAYGG